ncbi:hypothetical protein QAD02_004332 [Eretmocerus hayati]|uniref:Uncharacterized protein n=1 Tax=Eretmocerus hayati TaxID=131215 RepID=A0ACC2NPK3_9HYME|nr:hypothetical protein QAD02_004332 [Eretmocerus hayati]
MPLLPGDEEEVVSLMDLEENHAAVKYPRDEYQVSSSETLCIYYDEFIIPDKCRELCGQLPGSRRLSVINDWVICQPNLRCKCEVTFANGFPSFVNLDTLEAQIRHEVEQERAANVRHWIRTRNELDEIPQ